MKLHSKRWVAVLGLVASGTAAAADAKQEGVYAGLAIGRASGSAETYRIGSSPSFGFNLGYRFSANLSTEVFWRSLSFELFPMFQTRSYEYPDSHLGVAVIGSMPLSDSWALNARLGVGRTKMERSRDLSASGSRTSLSGGLSVSYAITPSFSMNLGYERYTKISSGVTLLGAELRF
ncbi:porin family protein [Pelomonas sp. CA6]|uniref:porin family protein n=1 Tax=Pelomonas sp. CA6 TaxID=2907999 RepID=UPI001F4B045F|nr:porin family protein [Pelomonas sp. CA6]MCH7342772.1 porin family protein [Pelomonas sp. CA6]